jgi:hypothetical protein
MVEMGEMATCGNVKAKAKELTMNVHCCEGNNFFIYVFYLVMAFVTMISLG